METWQFPHVKNEMQGPACRRSAIACTQAPTCGSRSTDVAQLPMMADQEIEAVAQDRVRQRGHYLDVRMQVLLLGLDRGVRVHRRQRFVHILGFRLPFEPALEQPAFAQGGLQRLREILRRRAVERQIRVRPAGLAEVVHGEVIALCCTHAYSSPWEVWKLLCLA